MCPNRYIEYKAEYLRRPFLRDVSWVGALWVISTKWNHRHQQQLRQLGRTTGAVSQTTQYTEFSKWRNLRRAKLSALREYVLSTPLFSADIHYSFYTTLVSIGHLVLTLRARWKRRNLLAGKMIPVCLVLKISLNNFVVWHVRVRNLLGAPEVSWGFNLWN